VPEKITSASNPNEYIVCEKVDDRYVCAVDGEVVLLSQNKVSSYRTNPDWRESYLVADGREYEEYYTNLLKERGAEEELERIEEAKENLEPIAEEMKQESEGFQEAGTEVALAQIQALRERVDELEKKIEEQG